jgi:hypothetical protein
VGSYICACKDGYAGNGKTCADIDECKVGDAACDKNATCQNEAGGYACTCKPGWSGDGKNCAEVDVCGVNNGGCDKNALCSKGAPGGPAKCACKPGWGGDGKACCPVKVTILVEGAAIHPVSGDGQTSWDNCSLNKEQLAGLEVALQLTGLGAYAGVVKALTGIVMGSTCTPDAFGTATWLEGGQDKTTANLPEAANTLLPSFGPPGKIAGVSLSQANKVRVHLVDADLFGYEHIGTVNLTSDHLSAALASGIVEHVKTASQGNGKILYVDVGVSAAWTCGDGACASAAGESSLCCPNDCKAVPAASCAGICGKVQAGSCSCDSLCTKFGDCCADFASKCGTVGCKGKCGMKSWEDGKPACWCDNLCVQQGDCCSDKKAQCP